MRGTTNNSSHISVFSGAESLAMRETFTANILTLDKNQRHGFCNG